MGGSLYGSHFSSLIDGTKMRHTNAPRPFWPYQTLLTESGRLRQPDLTPNNLSLDLVP